MSLRAVLAVQQVDLAITQAERRLAELPERAAHATASAAEAALALTERRLAARLAELREVIAGAERRGGELDAEIARLTSKLDGAGSVREAEALQHEIDARRAERSEADDRGLGAMDESESTTAESNRVASELAAARDTLAAATARLETAVAGIEAELDGLRRDRAERAALAPADLLARYESRRIERPNRVVAALSGSSCGGCHEELAPSELEALRRAADDELVACPNCSCWLVR